jgi:hypothetical protein
MCFASNYTRHTWTVDHQGSILKVEGVIIAMIEEVEPMLAFLELSTRDEKIDELKRIAEKSGFQKAPSQSNRLKAFTRALSSGYFAERIYPAGVHIPTTAQSEEALVDVLQGFEINDNVWENIRYGCQGRSFYLTQDGAPGLAPVAARPGDHVTVLIGCSTPMVLRPTKEGNYKVVGEAYCDGFIDGKALFGPFPDSFEVVSRHSPSEDAWRPAYLNRKTGVFQAEDPRLGPMPSGWSIKSHENEEFVQWFVNDETGEETRDPRLSSEALRKRGVPLQVFNLV